MASSAQSRDLAERVRHVATLKKRTRATGRQGHLVGPPSESRKLDGMRPLRPAIDASHHPSRGPSCEGEMIERRGRDAESRRWLAWER